MALTNSQYDTIMRGYDRRQYENYRRQCARTDEIYEKFPRIREIQEAMSACSIRQAERLFDEEPDALEILRQELSSLRAEKEQILKKAEVCGILLVLDECFLDFTDQESQSLIPQAVKSQHLFILKSFTKMYAIPGIRLGYGISGNKELIEKMEKSGPCWNVSVLASEAGIAALQEVEYCEQARRLICREREKLKEGLKLFGFRVWNGQADYLFFQTPGITDLYERLLPYGILIRRCSNYRGLDKTHYRIAVKSPEANEKLLEVLRKVLTEFYS